MDVPLFIFSTSALLLVQIPILPGSGPDRAAVVAALQHQEGLVKTLQAEFVCSDLLT
jgi:hypothetical protein